MLEKILDLFIYNWELLNFDFLNLYIYFPGTIWYKYIIISFLTSLISIIVGTSIGLICIKLWNLYHKYFNIKKNIIAYYNYPIIISIFFWILYPIYCIIFGVFWWKISKKIIFYIIITHFFITILLTILNLNMLWYI